MSDDDLGAAVPLDGDRLDALERLAEAATSGPWMTDDARPEDEVAAVLGPITMTGEVIRQRYIADDIDRLADAEFIAATDPPTVLALVAALRASWAEVERLTGERDQPVARIMSVCVDSERYAEIWNSGYEAAVAQGLADDPSLAEDWLAARDERIAAEANAERDEARAALAAVEALHRPIQAATVGGTDTICAECRREPQRWDDVVWPCPTIAASRTGAADKEIGR